MNHEVAWNWLWENVERMLKEMMGIPLTYEKALRNWILDLPEDCDVVLCAEDLWICSDRARAALA